MSEAQTSGEPGGWMSDQGNRLKALRAILAFTIVSTALHYTHNFVEIDSYPDTFVSGTVIQIAIVLSWPLLTAVALFGYRLYKKRSYPLAHACLALYSLLGLTTVGHFIDGNPDIPAFFYATIFTDFIGGASVLGFVLWSAKLTSTSRVSDASSPSS